MTKEQSPLTSIAVERVSPEKQKKIEYMTIASRDLATFDNLIMQAVNDGWTLYRRSFEFNGMLCQGAVRYKKGGQI